MIVRRLGFSSYKTKGSLTSNIKQSRRSDCNGGEKRETIEANPVDGAVDIFIQAHIELSLDAGLQF